MRALAALLAGFSVLALVPSGAAGPDRPIVECENDEDPFQHCRAGSVHWVTGPDCEGVEAHDDPAFRTQCWSNKHECDFDDDLYNHCRVVFVHWVTGPQCVGVRLGNATDCDIPSKGLP